MTRINRLLPPGTVLPTLSNMTRTTATSSYTTPSIVRNTLLLTFALASSCLLVAISFAAQAPDTERPNFLWLDAEDANINWFGCYGNPAATTPNIDQLAAEGFLYTHTFANAPVCSPSRSTWITGVMALSTGTVSLRSRNLIPHDLLRYYPDYLREAGYYCTNPGKTDYNIGGRPDREAWSGGDWRGREEGQPFFHVTHFPESHESRAFGDIDNPSHDPVLQRLRAYHPDIPDIRNNYAHYADQVERMDAAVGEELARLEEAGLADSTIVIFTTDHGGVMPGSKRFVTDSGTHSPLIVRIPEKFKHFWPKEKPGMTVDRLVSFVDMPKTWLSLAGAKVPDHMHGRVFLGPDKEPERDSHFAFTSRQANRYYEMRAVRTRNLLYIKNYKPYLSTGQHLGYLWRMQATQAWDEHHRMGQTDAITGAFFQPRQPVEELYDPVRDPDNVINLAHRAEHQEDLKKMRAKLREWQLNLNDTGLLPEEMMARRAREHGTTIYEMAQDRDLYDLPAYLEAADVALAADPRNTDEFISMLEDEDSGLRHWGVIGLLMLGELGTEEVSALASRLTDEEHVVRAIAAWALLNAGKEKEAARSCLIALLENQSHASLLALNVIDLSDDDVSIYLSAIEQAVDCNFGFNYGTRMKEYLTAKLEENR